MSQGKRFRGGRRFMLGLSVVLWCGIGSFNASADPGQPAVCGSVCDQWATQAFSYVNTVENRLTRQLDDALAFLDIRLGSNSFNVSGTGSIGSLTAPPFDIKNPQMPSGLSDFGVEPSYVLSGTLFGFKFNVVDLRLSARQERKDASSPGAEPGKGLRLNLKIVGIDIQNLRRSAPRTQADTRYGTAYARNQSNPFSDKTGTRIAPKDFRRSYSSMAGKKLTIPIIPPIVVVYLDFGFVLSAGFDFSFGIDTPLGALGGGRSWSLAPTGGQGPRDRKPYCDTTTNDPCPTSQMVQSGRAFQMDSHFYNSFGAQFRDVASAVQGLRDSLNKDNIDRLFSNAKQTVDRIRERANDPLLDYGSLGQPAKDALGIDGVCQAANPAAEMYAQLSGIYQNANLVLSTTQTVADLVKDPREILRRTRASVGAGASGAVSVWASADLGLDLVIAQAWVGLVGVLDLIKLDAAGELAYVPTSQFIDLSTTYRVTTLSGHLDLEYGVSVGIGGFSVSYSGSVNLARWPGNTHTKTKLIGRIDTKPAAGESLIAWCTGATPDPRCADGDTSRSIIAAPLQAYDGLLANYFGVRRDRPDDRCLVTDGTRVIATSPGSGCGAWLSPDSATPFLVPGGRTTSPLVDAYENDVAAFASTRMDASGRFKKTFVAHDGSSFTARTYARTAAIPNETSAAKKISFDLDFKIFAAEDRNVPANLVAPAMPAPLLDVDPVTKELNANALLVDSPATEVRLDDDRRVFVGDMNLVENESLVRSAQQFKLGQCFAIDRPGSPESFVYVGAQPYPDGGAANGSIYENVLDPDMGCLLDGTFEAIDRGETNGRSLIGSATGKAEYQACLLRRANAENRCFPNERIHALIKLGNLTNEDVVDGLLSSPKRIDGGGFVYSFRAETWRAYESGGRCGIFGSKWFGYSLNNPPQCSVSFRQANGDTTLVARRDFSPLRSGRDTCGRDKAYDFVDDPVRERQCVDWAHDQALTRSLALAPGYPSPWYANPNNPEYTGVFTIKRCLAVGVCTYDPDVRPGNSTSSCEALANNGPIPGVSPVAGASSLGDCQAKRASFRDASLFCQAPEVRVHMEKQGLESMDVAIRFATTADGQTDEETKPLGKCFFDGKVVVGQTEGDAFPTDGSGAVDPNCQLHAGRTGKPWQRLQSAPKGTTRAGDPASVCWNSFGFDGTRDAAKADEICHALPNSVISQLVDPSDAGKIELLLNVWRDGKYDQEQTCNVDLSTRENPVVFAKECRLEMEPASSGGALLTQKLNSAPQESSGECESKSGPFLDCAWGRRQPAYRPFAQLKSDFNLRLTYDGGDLKGSPLACAYEPLPELESDPNCLLYGRTNLNKDGKQSGNGDPLDDPYDSLINTTGLEFQGDPANFSTACQDRWLQAIPEFGKGETSPATCLLLKERLNRRLQTYGTWGNATNADLYEGSDKNPPWGEQYDLSGKVGAPAVALVPHAWDGKSGSSLGAPSCDYWFIKAVDDPLSIGWMLVDEATAKSILEFRKDAATPPSSLACDPGIRPFGGGKGSAENPYQVCSATHFQNLRTATTASFEIKSDLDFKDVFLTPIGTDGNPFRGQVNGNDHVLKHLVIEASGQDPTAPTGLFGVTKEANFRNIRIDRLNVEGGPTTGGFVGRAISSNFSGIRIEKLQIGGLAVLGGFAGEAVSGSQFRDLTLEGEVYARDPGTLTLTALGGVIGAVTTNAGFSPPTILTNVSMKGVVSHYGDSSTPIPAGGIVGRASSINCSNCRFVGSVFGKDFAGGLVGDLLGGGGGSSISDSRVGPDAEVYGNDAVGGLFGRAYDASVSRSQVHAKIIGYSYVGGAFGATCRTTTSQSLANVSVSAALFGGGFIGGSCSYPGDTGTRTLSVTDAYAVGKIIQLADGNIDPRLGGFIGDADAGPRRGFLESLRIYRSYAKMVPEKQILYTLNIVQTIWQWLVGAAKPVAPFGNYRAGSILMAYYYQPPFTNTDARALPLDSEKELTAASSYAGWDFASVWKIPTANPFWPELSPVLVWQCGRDGITCDLSKSPRVPASTR